MISVRFGAAKKMDSNATRSSAQNYAGLTAALTADHRIALHAGRAC
jgi:hypothetical protein